MNHVTRDKARARRTAARVAIKLTNRHGPGFKVVKERRSGLMRPHYHVIDKRGRFGRSGQCVSGHYYYGHRLAGVGGRKAALEQELDVPPFLLWGLLKQFLLYYPYYKTKASMLYYTARKRYYGYRRRKMSRSQAARMAARDTIRWARQHL